MKKITCPKCKEQKIEIYLLKNGQLGIWCKNCLFGIPNKEYGSKRTVKNAIKTFKEYSSAYINGKNR